MTRTNRYRACPLCEAICGLELRFEDERLVAIHGDDDDPFSRGHICPKGNAILDLEADPDRVRRPLRRDGSSWTGIGWDEAFALAGERLAAVQRAHGANAVGVYLGNPNVHHFGHIAYAPAFVRALKTRNVFSASSVDQWPHQVVAWAMYGHQFLLPIADVDRTDFLLMLGANPVASNGSLLTAPGITARLKALAKRGRLVVVDPRRTETAEIASEHVFVRPGTDALLLLGLLKVLRALGPPRTGAYEGRLRDAERAFDAGATLDAASIATATGVPWPTIERLATELWNAPRAAVYGRVGLSTQPYGTLCQWLIQVLALYTGNLDREGGLLPNEPAIPVTGPGTAKGHRGAWSSRVRGLPEFAGELPVAALAEEIATPGDGRIRALVTSAGNPVLSTPGGRGLEDALGTLDFMVAVDVYVNETTRFADLILPPASALTQWHYDVIFNAFAVRRVARLNAPVRDRDPEERADWEIFNGLGAAYAAAAGKSFQPLPEPRTLIGAGLARGGTGLTLADLDAAPHGLDLGPLRPSLLARLETDGGAIQCAPGLFLEDLERLVGRMGLEAIAASAAPTDASDAAASGRTHVPEKPSGDLLLIGRRDVRSNNSWMHNAPRLVKGKPRDHLLVHPDDLASRGLADGAPASLRSAVGAIRVAVRASDSVMRGVVCLPHGYGHQRDGVRLARASAVEGASYNDIADPAALDVPSGNAALNALPVWLEPLAT